MLVSGLDALPLTRVTPVELPEGHPDRDTFDTDLERIQEIRDVLNAFDDGDLSDEVFAGTPGGEVRTHLAIDMAEFELIGEDIAAWRAA